MADENKTEIQANLNVTSEGVDKVAEQLGKLSTSLDEIAKKVVDVSEKFEELGKKSTIKIDSHNVNIPKNRSRLAYGKFDYTYSTLSSTDRKNADVLSTQISKQLENELKLLKNRNKLLSAQVKKLEKDNTNYDEILANKTRDSKTRASNSITNAIVAQNTKRRTELNEGWLKYRSLHPEKFLSQNGLMNHEIGNWLLSGGQYVARAGMLGGLIGGGMQIGGSAIKSGGWAPFATGLTLATKAITDFTRASVEAYGQIESIKTQLSVVMGSDTQANSIFGEISRYAIKSPFGIEQTSELATLLKQSGVYATNLMDTLKMIGDTAGGNMEKMKRIANNYAQIVSIGKASMLDMRQFAYAGIPIFEAVSKELGVSQAQLRKLISDGKVTADIIEKVFKDLTGVNGLFENATEKGAKTLKARLQNMADSRQLMYSEFGQMIIGDGSSYKQDSYAIRGVSIVEGMYQKLQQWAAIKNIEKNVAEIQERDGDIQNLKTFIAFYRANGQDKKADSLQKELDLLLSRQDKSKDRATRASVYDERIKKIDELKEVLDQMPDVYKKGFLNYNLGSAVSEVTSYGILTGIAGLMTGGAWLARGGATTTANLLDTFNQIAFGLPPSKAGEDVYKAGSNYLDSTMAATKWGADKIAYYMKLYEAVNNMPEITPDLLRAYRERNTEFGQTGASDTVSSSKDKTQSILNVASEIQQEMEKSVEAQQKALEEQKKRWSEAIAIANKLYLIQDQTTGEIDTAKLTAKEFVNYVNKGALDVERKLSTNTDNYDKAKADKVIIEKQYEDYLRKIAMAASGGSLQLQSALRDGIGALKGDLKGETNLQVFYDKLTENITNGNEVLDSIETWVENENDKKILKDVRTLLNSITLRFSSNTAIKGANIDELLADKSKSTVHIPLWKRLLGNATGISPNVINSTKETLDAYRDDMAVRNTAKNVFSTILQNGGSVKDILKLLEVGGERKEFSDGSKAYQIDWKKTSDNLKAFSLRLSASTKVIDAYKAGLESQLKTYEDLLANAVTASETTDINGIKTKTLSASKWGELTKDQGDQLVNAFGEKIKTVTGEEVSYIKDGIAYDKQGNELQEQQIILTGNLFEWLEKELPELRKSVKEAKKQSDINSLLGELTENLGKQDIFEKLLLGASPEEARYIIGNRDSVIKNVIDNMDFSGSTIKNYNDLFAHQQGKLGNNSEFVEAEDIANEAVKLFFDNLREASKAPSTWEDHESYQNKIAGSDIYGKLAVPAAGDKGFWGNIKDSFASYGFLGKILSNQGLDIKGWDEAVSIKAQEEGLRNQVKEDNPNADIKELPKLYEEAADKAMKLALANKEIGSAISNAAVQMTDLSKAVGGQLLTSTFSSLGKALVTGASASEDMEENLKNACSQMVSGIGAAMTTAGFQIAGAAAASQQWGMVAAGLGLAAAGGFTSGIGGALSSVSSADPKEFEYNANDQYEKLESLKDQLVQILEQAQSDAQYYETTLRHKQAVGTTGNISATSVHDALIDTNGKIITTDPKDYLIATKNPKQLVGGGNVTVQPQITIMPVNNSRADVNVRTEQNINSDGSVEVIAYIEDAVGNYIASSRSDDAFNARQFRINGHQSVM